METAKVKKKGFVTLKKEPKAAFSYQPDSACCAAYSTVEVATGRIETNETVVQPARCVTRLIPCRAQRAPFD